MKPWSTLVIVRIAVLLAGILVALAVAEVGLRILGVSYPRWLQNDDLLGSVHRPGVSFHYRDEGDAIIRINKAGFRDRERTVPKPPGTVRIAMLGDSFVEAGQVNEDEMVTAVMERELNACRAFGDHPVEVLNFGVTGYGTAQELLLLREKVWAYSPDIVVLGFFTGNDFRNNTARLLRDPGRPYMVYRDSVLVYDASFRKTYTPLQALKRQIGYFLLDASRVAQVVYRARGQAMKRRSAAAKKEREEGLEMGLDDQIYVEPRDPAWQEAWRITEELLRTMRDEVRGHGAKLLVVTLSNGAQADPDPAHREATMKRLGTDNLFYPDDRLARFCEQEGISVFGLARPLQAYAAKNHVVLHGFPGQSLNTGHWNIEGHRIGGQLIARRISEEFGSVTCPGVIQ